MSWIFIVTGLLIVIAAGFTSIFGEIEGFTVIVGLVDVLICGLIDGEIEGLKVGDIFGATVIVDGSGLGLLIKVSKRDL